MVEEGSAPPSDDSGVMVKTDDLEFLRDVPLTVTVELGRGDISIRELLQIGQSSVVELDKLAGEPLEVYVNNKLVSRGEVVVVNDKYGIRLTDIITPMDSKEE